MKELKHDGGCSEGETQESQGAQLFSMINWVWDPRENALEMQPVTHLAIYP